MWVCVFAEGRKPARAGDAADTDGQRDPSDMMSKTRHPEAKIGVDCKMLFMSQVMSNYEFCHRISGAAAHLALSDGHGG